MSPRDKQETSELRSKMHVLRDGICVLGERVTNVVAQLSLLIRRIGGFDDRLSRIEKRFEMVES